MNEKLTAKQVGQRLAKARLTRFTHIPRWDEITTPWDVFYESQIQYLVESGEITSLFPFPPYDHSRSKDTLEMWRGLVGIIPGYEFFYGWVYPEILRWENVHKILSIVIRDAPKKEGKK